MNIGIELFVGCFLLSSAICYAWWIKLRVWAFRQELFTIRDNLWDAMNEAGTLADPDYQLTRNAINATIRMAPMISIIMLYYLLIMGKPDEKLLHVPSLEAVNTAREKIVLLLLRYVTRGTLTGIVLGFLVHVYATQESLRRAINFLLSSKDTVAIARNLA